MAKRPTNIPAPRVDFIDPGTGLMSREWYRFLFNQFEQSGGGSGLSHNGLVGLQGGAGGAYYHLGQPDYTGNGTGVLVRSTSPVLVAPALGTPVSGNITNCTGSPILGWNPPTADLPMGGHKFSGISNGAAANEFASFGQTQNSDGTFLTGVAGTNAITATLPVLSAYALGQTFTLIPAVTNTGAVTLNINGIGAIAVTKGTATALAGGEISAGSVYQVTYDGTRFLISNVPGRVLQTSYYVDAGNGPGGTTSVFPTYANASSALWSITPVSATSVLIFNISMQLQIGIIAATNTVGYCNIYVGTAATPTTASGRYTYAISSTLGLASSTTAAFSFQLSSGSTSARNYGVSAATNNAGVSCTAINITGTCMEVQP